MSVLLQWNTVLWKVFVCSTFPLFLIFVTPCCSTFSSNCKQMILQTTVWKNKWSGSDSLTEPGELRCRKPRQLQRSTGRMVKKRKEGKKEGKNKQVTQSRKKIITKIIYSHHCGGILAHASMQNFCEYLMQNLCEYLSSWHSISMESESGHYLGPWKI